MHVGGGGCSACGELRVGEDLLTVGSVGELADDSGVHVVLAEPELLCEFEVDALLRASVGRSVVLTAVLLVTVLLRGPALVLLLGGMHEDLLRQGGEGRVHLRERLVHFLGRLIRDLVVKVLRRLVVEGSTRETVNS